jgi:hypothetical protein
MSSYIKTNWVDRNIERPKTFTSSTNLDGSVTFTDAPGTVYAAGTAVTAARMNNIESGVETAFNKSMTHDRELANIEAALDIDNRAIQNSGKFYDLFDGTNNYSAGLLDTTITALNGAHSAGIATVTVDSTTGFVVGQEITLQDDTNREDKIIQSINSGVNQLTFTANLASNYKDDASVYRSNVSISANKMNFGSWTNIITYTNSTPVQVINAAYETATSSGRKIVMLSNGWLISALTDNSASALKFYKSIDNGTTWTFLTSWTQVTYGSARCSICSYNNIIHAVANTSSANQVIYVNFDATTVGSTVTTSTNVDTGQSAITPTSSPSIAVGSTGILHVTYSTRNSTYSAADNIRYSKSINSGTSWTNTQITTNGGSNNCLDPVIVIKSDDNPLICYRTTNVNPIYVYGIYYTGSAWSTPYSIFTNASSTYSQTALSAVKSPDGNIHLTWQGLDATDTTANNIRYSKTTNGGTSWSTATKLTTGNTYNQITPSITADKNNNIYVVWSGITSSSGGVYELRELIYNGSTWGSIVELTTGAGIKSDPSTCSNFTDFTYPLLVYKDATNSKVMYLGVLQAIGQTALTSNIARYNIIPPTGTSTEIVSWIQHERATPDTDFVVTAYESIVDTSANESYTAMTKTTSNLSASLAEEQFLMTPSSAQEKVTLKVIMTRATTSVSKAITKLLGAVG